MTTRRIPWTESAHGGPLGRNVEHDPRSRAHPAAAGGPPHFALHVRHGKILNQGNLGSCTGNALTGALMTERLFRPHHNYGEALAVVLYERATMLDGFPGIYPPNDTGSSGLAVCKAGVERGYLTGYQHAFGIDQALAALVLGPVITGVNWYSGFDHVDPLTGLVRLGGTVRGGHEFLVRGYDPGDGDVRAWWGIGHEPTVLCDNSWGGTWGRRGSFVMTVADWSTLLDQQGDVTRPLRK